MKQAEYKQTQDLVLGFAQNLDACFENLDEFIAAIDRADAAGTVINPSLWQEGHENMQHIKTIAEAIREARNKSKPAMKKLLENLNNKEV